MNLTFTHIKLLIQLHDSPLIVSSLNGRRILALQELEKAELVNSSEGRAHISALGLTALEYLQESLNAFVGAKE